MHRRTFLAGAAASASVPGLAFGAAAGPVPQAVHLLTTYVAGTAYTDARGIAPELKAGQDLNLIRAVENRFDPRTIDVWAGSVRLGSLPGIDSRILAGLLDAGLSIRATVNSVRVRPDKPEIRVDLAVSSIPGA